MRGCPLGAVCFQAVFIFQYVQPPNYPVPDRGEGCVDLVPPKDGAGSVVGIAERLPATLHAEVRQEPRTRHIQELGEGYPHPLRVLGEVGYPVDRKDGDDELEGQPKRNEGQPYEQSQEERCRLQIG